MTDVLELIEATTPCRVLREMTRQPYCWLVTGAFVLFGGAAVKEGLQTDSSITWMIFSVVMMALYAFATATGYQKARFKLIGLCLRCGGKLDEGDHDDHLR